MTELNPSSRRRARRGHTARRRPHRLRRRARADKDAAGGDVASLATPAAPTSATPAGGAANGRPQLRLDTTDEEEERLWGRTTSACMSNGVKLNDGRSAGPIGDGTGLSLDQSGEPKAAYDGVRATSCRSSRRSWTRRRTRTTSSQWNDYVQCLRGRGLKIHSLPDGSGWTYDDGVADPTGRPRGSRPRQGREGLHAGDIRCQEVTDRRSWSADDSAYRDRGGGGDPGGRRRRRCRGAGAAASPRR